MDVSELVREYSTARRTVNQEMLWRQLQRCCGECTGWYHGWAHMLHMRNIEDREPWSYFHMDIPEFKTHIRACTLAMEDIDRVDSCIEGLNTTWEKDWRNPAENRFNQDMTAAKKAEYRRLHDGGCVDPDYRIDG